MNYRHPVRERLASVFGLPGSVIPLERTRVAGSGDLTTTHILKTVRKEDRAAEAGRVAEILACCPEFSAATATGPGFVNLTISDDLMRQALVAVTLDPTPAAGRPEKVCVEFVSANPTGPLHVGHANGAFVGSAIAAMLERAGHEVTREYYVNDRGGQIETMGRSVIQRMRKLSGLDGVVPTDGYPGEYLVPVAERLLKDTDIRAWEARGAAAAGQAAAHMIISDILDNLGEIGIEFDSVVSESGVIVNGGYERAKHSLARIGSSYRGTLPAPLGETDPDWVAQETLIFRSTEMGDDADRALEKADGSPTYFGADCAYHQDKIERGFDRLVNVLGADHAGYTARIGAFVQAVAGMRPDFKMTSLVKLQKDGLPVTMSKRSGSYVTVTDAARLYGSENLRYFLLSKAQDDLIVLDTEKGLGRDIFGEILDGLRKAEDALAWVDDCNNLWSFADNERMRSYLSQFQMPEPGPLRDLAVMIMETPEVMSRAVRDLSPNIIAEHALTLAGMLREAAPGAEIERALILTSGISALRSCVLSCGTPEEALSPDFGKEPAYCVVEDGEQLDITKEQAEHLLSVEAIYPPAEGHVHHAREGWDLDRIEREIGQTELSPAP